MAGVLLHSSDSMHKVVPTGSVRNYDDFVKAKSLVRNEFIEFRSQKHHFVALFGVIQPEQNVLGELAMYPDYLTIRPDDKDPFNEGIKDNHRKSTPAWPQGCICASSSAPKLQSRFNFFLIIVLPLLSFLTAWIAML